MAVEMHSRTRVLVSLGSARIARRSRSPPRRPDAEHARTPCSCRRVRAAVANGSALGPPVTIAPAMPWPLGRHYRLGCHHDFARRPTGDSSACFWNTMFWCGRREGRFLRLAGRPRNPRSWRWCAPSPRWAPASSSSRVGGGGTIPARRPGRHLLPALEQPRCHRGQIVDSSSYDLTSTAAPGPGTEAGPVASTLARAFKVSLAWCPMTKLNTNQPPKHQPHASPTCANGRSWRAHDRSMMFSSGFGLWPRPHHPDAGRWLRRQPRSARTARRPAVFLRRPHSVEQAPSGFVPPKLPRPRLASGPPRACTRWTAGVLRYCGKWPAQSG